MSGRRVAAPRFSPAEPHPHRQRAAAQLAAAADARADPTLLETDDCPLCVPHQPGHLRQRMLSSHRDGAPLSALPLHIPPLLSRAT